MKKSGTVMSLVSALRQKPKKSPHANTCSITPSSISNKVINNSSKSVGFSSFINDTHNPQNSETPQNSISIPKKGQGSVRLVYENFNGLCPWRPHNDKLTLIKSILKQINADGYLGVESRANWSILPPKSQLRHIFSGDTPVRTLTSHNTHEKIMRAQEGGTAIIAFDKLALSISSSSSDPLGRWCSISLNDKNDNTTHIMVAYQAPKTPCSHIKATYNQQKRYSKSTGNFRCPKKNFRADLDKILTEWRNKGDRVILFIDANENLKRDAIKKLTKKHNMHDMVKKYSGLPGPPTFFRGSTQIDGVFATDEVSCHFATYLPFFSLIGDHRGIVIDIPEQCLYGKQSITNCHPQRRRLQCNRHNVKQKYIKTLTKHLLLHKIPQKLQKLCSPYYCQHRLEAKSLQENIDKIKKEAMIHAESKCRKYGMGNVPFSPNILIWKIGEISGL